MRARVRALPNLRFLDRCDVVGLATTPDGRRVTGVRVLRRADGSAEEAAAAPTWWSTPAAVARAPRHGWTHSATPGRSGSRCRSGWATPPGPTGCQPDALDGDLATLVAATPEHPRTGALQRLEGDRWMLTLAGILGDHPPTDPDGFLDFARSLRVPRHLRRDPRRRAAGRPGRPSASPPASDTATNGSTASRPACSSMGDAVCSFNPIYGQGMSVAALEALTLRRHLARGIEPQPRRWFRDLARVVDVPWEMAAGGDLILPRRPGTPNPQDPADEHLHRPAPRRRRRRRPPRHRLHPGRRAGLATPVAAAPRHRLARAPGRPHPAARDGRPTRTERPDLVNAANRGSVTDGCSRFG